MEFFLDVIVPEYDCPQEYMIRLLNSINRQKNVDFNEIGVIIINDKSKVKYKRSWFKQRFPKLNISYIVKNSNEGQGLTRQYGIDISKAEYITFIDQDDELFGDTCLSAAIGLLKERRKPFAISSIYEEVLFEGKMYFKEHSCFEFKSLHGLFINRNHLIANNIRFHKDLRQFEDVYFNSCLFYSNVEFDYFNFFTYIWKFNFNSQVRKQSKYTFEVKNFKYYFLCTKYSIEYLKKCNSIVLTEFSFVSLYGCLLILKSKYYDFEELKNDRIYYLNELKKLYLEFVSDYQKLTDEERSNYKTNEYNVLSRSMPELNHVDIDEFINS